MTIDVHLIPLAGDKLSDHVRHSRIDIGLCTCCEAAGRTFLTCPNKSVRARAAALAATDYHQGKVRAQEWAPR